MNLSEFGLFFFISKIHLTFGTRLCISLMTSFICMLFFGLPFIQWATRHCKSVARLNVSIHHKKKAEIPTMGGLLIVGVIALNMMLWCSAMLLVFVLPFFLLFGLLGVFDDWYKIRHGKGITVRIKFLIQLIIAFLFVYTAINGGFVSITLPFFSVIPWSAMGAILKILAYGWLVFIVVGVSNAVNLTDGLDGLAVHTLIPNFFLLLFCAYFFQSCFMQTTVHFDPYIIADTGIVAAISIGTLAGFLWYNSYPAQIFMGDVGSLSLGALLAMMVLMLHFEWFLLISGCVLVAETVSVIIQMSSYYMRGKRLLRMAPIHHHFELTGMHEQKIVTRAAIISWLMSLMALVIIMNKVV